MKVESDTTAPRIEVTGLVPAGQNSTHQPPMRLEWRLDEDRLMHPRGTRYHSLGPWHYHEPGRVGRVIAAKAEESPDSTGQGGG